LVAVGIGVFDGVHLGHMKILERVVEYAKTYGLASKVMTFSPHPDYILSPQNAPLLLMDLETRVSLIREAGIEKVYVQPFTAEYARMEPEDFVKDVLLKDLKAKIVVVGFDFIFGKDGRGNTELLADLCGRHGIMVDVVSSVHVDGQVIASTRIRDMLASGYVSGAKVMLGRRYALKGTVVKGYGRGRALGYPTANLAVSDMVVVPKDGVYAVLVSYGAQRYFGVCNIGSNPTFGVGKRSVEVHILDFCGSLYDQVLHVEFLEYLRDEAVFQNEEGLRMQIKSDIEQARELFEHNNNEV
jgi:riboflavin kinase/FMN adenylyltransferase